MLNVAFYGAMVVAGFFVGFLKDIHVPIATLDYATIQCTNNKGIEYIEAHGTGSVTIKCMNGAQFETRIRQ